MESLTVSATRPRTSSSRSTAARSTTPTGCDGSSSRSGQAASSLSGLENRIELVPPTSASTSRRRHRGRDSLNPSRAQRRRAAPMPAVRGGYVPTGDGYTTAYAPGAIEPERFIGRLDRGRVQAAPLGIATYVGRRLDDYWQRRDYPSFGLTSHTVTRFVTYMS